MITADTHILLKKAAAPSLERIWLDYQKAPACLQPFLELIGHNLFDQELSVSYLRARVAAADQRLLDFFESAIGHKPFNYIENRRMKTACRLLEQTNLLVWQITELLGFSAIGVFSRAFARWSGMRPTVYRAHQRPSDGGQPFSLKRLAKSAGMTESRLLRQLAAGRLDSKAANILIDRLRKLYPDTG